METKTRKPSSRTIKNEELQQDLIIIREKALELGAADAVIIPASHVVVQERVWLKCIVPRCGGAGLSAYCPPNTPEPDFMRKAFSQYQWAVVFKRNVEPIEDYIPNSEDRNKEIISRLLNRGFVHGNTWEILGRLESYAQSIGYDLSMGFSAGSCRACLCALAPCAVLQNEPCRHPLKSRPSMEAVGIDVFDLAAKVGWNVYMVRVIEPKLSEIPCVLSIGIVFVY
jgi:predicted metal-binding protein